MRAAILGSIVVTSCVMSSLGALRAADPPAVTFAVIRADGILIPFATRAGRRWSNAWPQPERRRTVPIRVADLPARWWGRTGVSTTWHAWTVDGRATVATIARPAWYPAHCQKGVGLQTDVRPPGRLPPLAVTPYPKLGLASTTPVAFERVETLDERSPMWAPLLKALAKPFAADEARVYLLRLSGEGPAPPLKHPRGLPGAVRLERLYRMPLRDGWFAYYYEATRQYPAAVEATRPDAPSSSASQVSDACEGASLGVGWFVANTAEPPARLSVDVDLMSCDYDRAWTMLPLGYLPDGEGGLLISQFSGPNREVYAVLRMDARRSAPALVFGTPGGRCGPPAPISIR